MSPSSAWTSRGLQSIRNRIKAPVVQSTGYLILRYLHFMLHSLELISLCWLVFSVPMYHAC
jgi:hypothetical protein